MTLSKITSPMAAVSSTSAPARAVTPAGESTRRPTDSPSWYSWAGNATAALARKIVSPAATITQHSRQDAQLMAVTRRR